MKIILLRLRPSSNTVLPITHKHFLQSAIYSLLSKNLQYSSGLHEYNFSYDSHNFRLFTFNNLNKKRTAEDRLVRFESDFEFGAQTLDKRFVNIMIESLRESGGIQGYNIFCELINLYIFERQIYRNNLRIGMLTPVTVYKTGENGKTIYFTPLDDEFINLINKNFCNKYLAAYGHMLGSGVFMHPELKGFPTHLKFLYYTCMVARNSQGLGVLKMFSQGKM